MPELPEVETIRRDLEKNILNQKITKVEVLLPRIVKNTKANFIKKLKGQHFNKIDRVGKLLIFSINPSSLAGGKVRRSKGDLCMLVHLKMTGQLIYKENDNVIAGGHSDSHDPAKVPNRWTRVIFSFGKKKLYFNDLRTFGYLKIIQEKKLEEIKNNFGPDFIQTEIDFEEFKRRIKKRQTSIKAILLDQKFISGLGNIYVDEVLFLAGVLPHRKGSKLKGGEIKKIYKNIKPVLMKAINNRGTTFNNYVDGGGKTGKMIDKLYVFARTGKKCKKCANIIEKTKVAGRGTHYCKNCQN